MARDWDFILVQVILILAVSGLVLLMFDMPIHEPHDKIFRLLAIAMFGILDFIIVKKTVNEFRRKR
jgi:hypothetical protein